MAKRLRVLLVEDSEDDAQLLLRELRRGGFDVAMTRVETAEAMAAALAERPWDVVISDYTLPHFNAPAALATLQSSGLDLPFVIVSGTVGEDAAVEGMRAGAQDFLLKGSLTRLAPAIEREVEQATKRQRRRQAEEDTERALRDSEAQKRAILESSLDGLITIDHAGRVLEMSAAAEKMFGYTARDVLGRDIAELIVPQHLRDAHRQALDRNVKTGESHILGQRIEMPAKHADGKLFPVELSVVRIDSDGNPLFTAWLRDITDRKKAEANLQRLAAIVESSYDAIIGTSPAGLILTWNQGAESLYGWTAEEVLGKSISLLEPSDRSGEIGDVIAAERAGSGVLRYESERLRKDGSRVEVSVTLSSIRDASGALVGFASIARDVTEQRQLEQKLRQSQKMEAIGQLAGGIAHDFNNILTAILGYASLLAETIPPNAAGREETDEIVRAAERAASLTRQLLAFSRRQVLEPIVFSINDALSSLQRMLARLIPESVTLSTRLDSNAGNVRADPGQIEQVVMNLVINARDAMPGGGHLTIETAAIDLEEAYALRHVTVEAGRYVMVAVSDTGTGMNSETQQHIFEPFFTTKEKGRGTGLGLSTVYGIVKQSGGNIWVYSELGKGTTVKVYLPRADEDVASQNGVHAPSALPAAGTETVLLVEDEDSIRALSVRILEERGYRVIPASGGRPALEAARAHAGTIHLLVTDLIMPDLSGTELAARLLVDRPGIRVLFMSGYTDDAVVRNGLLEKERAFLQKPFTPLALARKVRETLS